MEFFSVPTEVVENRQLPQLLGYGCKRAFQNLNSIFENFRATQPRRSVKKNLIIIFKSKIIYLSIFITFKNRFYLKFNAQFFAMQLSVQNIRVQ